MRCTDCGQEFGIFDQFIPVYQLSIRDNEVVQQVGYMHLWHLRNPDPQP